MGYVFAPRAGQALAASLLGTDADGLVLANGSGDRDPRFAGLRDGPLLGALFESLVALSLRVYAAPLRLDGVAVVPLALLGP